MMLGYSVRNDWWFILYILRSIIINVYTRGSASSVYLFSITKAEYNVFNKYNQNTNNEYRYSFRFIQAKLDINTEHTSGILNQSSDPSTKVGYNFQ